MTHSEPTIVVNQTILTNAQAIAVRVAVTSFRDWLSQGSNRAALGPIADLYDARLQEVEELMFGHVTVGL